MSATSLSSVITACELEACLSVILFHRQWDSRAWYNLWTCRGSTALLLGCFSAQPQVRSRLKVLIEWLVTCFLEVCCKVALMSILGSILHALILMYILVSSNALMNGSVLLIDCLWKTLQKQSCCIDIPHSTTENWGLCHQHRRCWRLCHVQVFCKLSVIVCSMCQASLATLVL